MKLLLSQSQFKNTSVTNHVKKVTNVFAVLKTNADYINMLECVNVYAKSYRLLPRRGGVSCRKPSAQKVVQKFAKTTLVLVIHTYLYLKIYEWP